VSAVRHTSRAHQQVWLEHDQLKALRALLERDGVPIAEQIRRGVDLWLEKKKK
jgi:hypothetical protein